MLHTPLCDLLGIQYPIVNAPMNPEAGEDLAVAVAEAGGLGLFSISRSMTREQARARVADVRARTNRPFGGGMVAAIRRPDDAARIERVVRDVVEAGAPYIGISFAPSVMPYVRIAHANGARVLTQVQTVAMARAAADAGADVIVAQGTDAGGHTGAIGTMSIVPAIVDVVGNVPVVASGGIADGRGLAAALMLGAQGAWMGSAFLLSDEAETPRFVRERLRTAGTDDTVWTKVFDHVMDLSFPPNVKGRALRNLFIERWQDRESEASTRRFELLEALNAGYARGDPEMHHLWASSAIGLVRRTEPAAEVIWRLCAEAETVLMDRVRVTVR